MDPISDSCCNLNANNLTSQLLAQKHTDEKYQEILGSCRSVSKYEEKNFKTLTPQIIAAVIVASYHVIIGISISYTSILLPQLQEHPDFEVSNSDGSWIASIIALTTPAGSLIVGVLMDRFGRINTLRLATIPGIAGWVIIALAQNVPLLILGRALVGFANALGSNPTVVYLTEIARKDMRGSLISICPSLTSLGMILTFAMGWSLSWRNVAWICCVFSLLPCLLVIFIPESPAWLVSKDRIQEARKALNWIYKYQPPVEDKNLSIAELQLALLQKERELKMIEITRRKEGQISAIWHQCLKPTCYKPLLILTGLYFFQQFSGTFIFLFYSITFFQQVGSKFNPYFSSMFIGILRLLISLSTSYLFKRFKKRPLMMISSLSVATFAFLSGLFAYWIKNSITTLTWLPVVSLLLYMVSSMIGLVPIPHIMAAEVFPLEIRGVANSIARCVASFVMFLSIQTYPLLLEGLGGIINLLFFFGGTSILAIAYEFVFLPETQGKALKEIEEYFKGNVIFIGRKKKTKFENRRNKRGEVTEASPLQKV